MTDLEKLFPPNIDELKEQDEVLFAVYFVKPYDIKLAKSFMRMYNFSQAYAIESESVYIFYQKYEYVPWKDVNYSFDYKLSDDIVWTDLKKVRDHKLLFRSYFSNNVVFVTYRNPDYSVFVMI